MSYKAEFSGWNSLAVEDLLIAYRKAKADCFFENTFPAAAKFAEYEKNLLSNLRELLAKLNQEDFSADSDLLGEFRLLPKKLGIDKKKNLDPLINSHIHFSKPERAVDSLFDNYNIIPEFRIVGDFPVDTHIISALWINMVGHKYDAQLKDNCYGARLRRLLGEDKSNKEERKFHLSSIGSFYPYFKPYQKWRSDGLNAIRDELKKDRDVIALSLDLKSYYHTIDPLAFISPEFIGELDLNLTEEDIDFTKKLTLFLNQWSKKAAKFGEQVGGDKNNINGGLVIGLTCSRIFSNALLHKWDKLIIENIAPIHYGRYVDDMFIVIRDTANIKNSSDMMNFLQKSIGHQYFNNIQGSENLWEINLSKCIQGNSKILLQQNKQKLFILQGRAGLDLLDSIEREIYELSSEHRLMPSPAQLDNSTAAKVLSAEGSVGESADTLGRADGLTVRRLGWALQLRHVEALARDLPPNEWKEQRDEFYEFAHNHILRADNLFAHFNHLPRLIGFAISINEWDQANKIALKSYEALSLLESKIVCGKAVKINGSNATVTENFWRYIKGTLTWLFIDAATRHIDTDNISVECNGSYKKILYGLFINQISVNFEEVENLLNLNFNVAEFEKNAHDVALSDLAKIPYKKLLNSKSAKKLIIIPKNKIDYVKKRKLFEKKILEILGKSGLIDPIVFERFIEETYDKRLEKIRKKSKVYDSLLPYLFPTRPLSAAEISELAPTCVGLPLFSGNNFHSASTWAKYTQVLRGVWVKPTLLASIQDDKKDKPKKPFLNIGTDKNEKVIIAITNIKIEDEDWANSASNKPNLNRIRYERLSKLVNETLGLSPKPDYVIFPELSIPLRWVDSVAGRLNAAGISLIAGAEYKHIYKNKVLSEAVLILKDNRLGYPTFVKIWQPKIQPAVGEDKELHTIHGKKWSKSSETRKPVYIHNGVNFGVMVCSELQNSKARVRFQGNVDALIVLSWNRDLDTFSSLIESAALDIHAYTILVNNRKYGDSRVRSPAKDRFLRDIARLRGGDNDYVVSATLNIGALRAFQSRAKRWPKETDIFKPVPEGFKLDKSRIKLPPK